MENASMTSETVAEHEAVESAADVSAKAVDDHPIEEPVTRAQAEGLHLTGEGGLLQLTKRLLESTLEGKITDHLGHDKHDPAGKNGADSRNGKRSKTVLTDLGPVEMAVPVTVMARSNRRSSRSGRGACPASPRWSSRRPPRT
jgi:hypothetical protein